MVFTENLAADKMQKDCAITSRCTKWQPILRTKLRRMRSR
jgi:hypothetical protein